MKCKLCGADATVTAREFKGRGVRAFFRCSNGHAGFAPKLELTPAPEPAPVVEPEPLPEPAPGGEKKSTLFERFVAGIFGE
jgi:hypothetical protein